MNGMSYINSSKYVQNERRHSRLADHDKWRCQHEMALVGPERVVLELDPGAHYAAGKRGTKMA